MKATLMYLTVDELDTLYRALTHSVDHYKGAIDYFDTRGLLGFAQRAEDRVGLTIALQKRIMLKLHSMKDQQ